MEDAQIFLMLLPEKAAQHDLVSCGESELFMSNDSALALEQPEATKVKLPDFPICSRSLSIPGRNTHLQQLLLELARVQMAEHSNWFPSSHPLCEL